MVALRFRHSSNSLAFNIAGAIVGLAEVELKNRVVGLRTRACSKLHSLANSCPCEN